MLEQKQGQIGNLHVIGVKLAIEREHQFSSYFSDYERFSNSTTIISQILIFFLPLTCNKKFYAWKVKISFSCNVCRISCRFENCSCFCSNIDSFWLLFFWRSKNTFYKRGIYIYIYWVLFWSYVAVNASNQGIICACMIFLPSCFISIYIFFIYELCCFYDFGDNEVTTLLWLHALLDRSWWNLHSIWLIEKQAHFVHEHFSIIYIFYKKITIYYEN